MGLGQAGGENQVNRPVDSLIVRIDPAGLDLRVGVLNSETRVEPHLSASMSFPGFSRQRRICWP